MSTPGGDSDHWGLADRRLYLCTPDRSDLEAFVGRCIAGGVDVVQLREKHLDDTALVRRAGLVQRVCAAEGVPFVLANPDAQVSRDVVAVAAAILKAPALAAVRR